MKSAIENVVVLVRVCGRAFAVRRRGDAVQVRPLPTARKAPAPPDQSAALKLLRGD